MRNLIFGAGYLGLRIAERWRETGRSVHLVTRSAERAAAWRREGYEASVADVTEQDSLRSLPSDVSILWAVGYDRSAEPSKTSVYVDGLRSMLQRFPAAPLTYVSSTSVYPAGGGRLVDETTAANPDSDGGRICQQAEELLQGRATTAIVRLAGIYGPDRTLARQAQLHSRRPLAGSGEEFLNLIHVDDAAAICGAVHGRLRSEASPTRWLGSDGSPVRRRDFYAELASLTGAPPPTFDGQPRAGRPLTDRRCDSSHTRRELGITLRFPSYREGLRDAIGQESPSDRASDTGTR